MDPFLRYELERCTRFAYRDVPLDPCLPRGLDFFGRYNAGLNLFESRYIPMFPMDHDLSPIYVKNGFSNLARKLRKAQFMGKNAQKDETKGKNAPKDEIEGNNAQMDDIEEGKNAQKDEIKGSITEVARTDKIEGPTAKIVGRDEIETSPMKKQKVDI